MTDPLDLVRRFVGAHHPKAEVALLTGSRARGDAGPQSDHDIVLLFAALPEGAWREMVRFEDEDLELFAHDLATLAYFCLDVDRPSGIAALPKMVVEGVSALKPSATLEEARRIARDCLALGPPPLTSAALEARRFEISDLAASLTDGRDRSALLASGTALYPALADFALRANDRWSATGKAIPTALLAADAALAQRFEQTFTALFAGGRTGPVQALVDAVLAPHGGRCRAGFRRTAPPDWRAPRL